MTDKQTRQILDGIKWLESNPQNFSASEEGEQYWVDAEVTRRVGMTQGEFAGTTNILEFGVSRTYGPTGRCAESVLSVGITPIKDGKEGDRIGVSFGSEAGELDADVIETMPDEQRSRAASIITALRARIEHEGA